MDTKFNILVVDESTERRYIRMALSLLGCSVTEADTTESGIIELSTVPYSMVFASLCVRNIGARGLARWVKTNKPDIKFFIITSWKGELEKNVLKVDGIHGIIHKPLLFTEIRDILHEYQR